MGLGCSLTPPCRPESSRASPPHRTSGERGAAPPALAPPFPCPWCLQGRHRQPAKKKSNMHACTRLEAPWTLPTLCRRVTLALLALLVPRHRSSPSSLCYRSSPLPGGACLLLTSCADSRLVQLAPQQVLRPRLTLDRFAL